MGGQPVCDSLALALRVKRFEIGKRLALLHQDDRKHETRIPAQQKEFVLAGDSAIYGPDQKGFLF
jgi:hypothetical protein